ncbi:hypothetical protein J6590_020030 [Homalodisca vitripennis]|nr:hypothetical protein J6590_020030 [Homalodisca vitripennis]
MAEIEAQCGTPRPLSNPVYYKLGPCVANQCMGNITSKLGTLGASYSGYRPILNKGRPSEFSPVERHGFEEKPRRLFKKEKYKIRFWVSVLNTVKVVQEYKAAVTEYKTTLEQWYRRLQYPAPTKSAGLYFRE